MQDWQSLPADTELWQNMQAAELWAAVRRSQTAKGIVAQELEKALATPPADLLTDRVWRSWSAVAVCSAVLRKPVRHALQQLDIPLTLTQARQ